MCAFFTKRISVLETLIYLLPSSPISKISHKLLISWAFSGSHCSPWQTQRQCLIDGSYPKRAKGRMTVLALFFLNFLPERSHSRNYIFNCTCSENLECEQKTGSCRCHVGWIASTETLLSPAGGDLCKYTNNYKVAFVVCLFVCRLFLMLNIDYVVMCQMRTQLNIFWKCWNENLTPVCRHLGTKRQTITLYKKKIIIQLQSGRLFHTEFQSVHFSPLYLSFVLGAIARQYSA